MLVEGRLGGVGAGAVGTHGLSVGARLRRGNRRIVRCVGSGGGLGRGRGRGTLADLGMGGDWAGNGLGDLVAFAVG